MFWEDRVWALAYILPPLDVPQARQNESYQLSGLGPWCLYSFYPELVMACPGLVFDSSLCYNIHTSKNARWYFLKMLGVLSGFINAIGWENGILEIWMNNGVGYRYHGVTEEQYHSLFVNSDFGRNFRKLKPVLQDYEKFPLHPRQ